MISFPALAAFALIMSVAIATPGPTVLLALSNGSRFGLQVAAFGMAGAILADVLLVGLVGLGFGALLAASETLFVVIKWLGVAWLAYLGIGMIRSSGALPMAGACADAPTPSAALSKGFLVAMSNPKYYLFMTAFLPQFVDTARPIGLQYAMFALVIVTIDIVMMSAYALFGKQSVRVLKASGVKWMCRLSGACLLVLAGSIAIYRRTA
jgi:threonine/homoserine/homoserine lactone efflux protein